MFKNCRSILKCKMLNLSGKNTWKPIDVSKTLVTNAQNLIAIEECVDYDLETILKTNKGYKRKERLDDNESGTKTEFNNSSIPNVSKRQVKAKKTHNSLNTVKPSTQGATDLEMGHFKIEGMNVVASDLLEGWNFVPLPDKLLQGLQTNKFFKPTPIQYLTLPAALLGRRDILGAAETGSGKTLAFGLPMLAGILELKSKSNELRNKQKFEEHCTVNNTHLHESVDSTSACLKMSTIQKPLYGLILTPTRELAVQIKNHLTSVAKFTDIKIAVIVGGLAEVKQDRILSKGPEIVVATPGRLWELIEKGNPHLSQVDSIRYLAIDETDRMVESGHFQELHNLLEKINANQNKEQRQTFVFSATLTLVHELPRYLVTKKKLKLKKNVTQMRSSQKLEKIIDTLGLVKPKIIDIAKGMGIPTELSECRIVCRLEEKDYYVFYFLKRYTGRTLIFCNSIGCVKRLSSILTVLNCTPLPLHSSMQQRQRLKNLDRFRDLEDGVLIATDVAARGLDIPCIEHVLHYQTPRTSEIYIHRSGRTARASKQGISVLLVDTSELQDYLRLCRTLEKADIPLFPVEEQVLTSVKERVNLGRQLEKLEHRAKKKHSETNWLKKSAKEMDILLEDGDSDNEIDGMNSFKKLALIKRKQLQQLLAQPIFPKGFSGKYPLTLTTKNNVLIAKKKIVKALDVLKLNAIKP